MKTFNFVSLVITGIILGSVNAMATTTTNTPNVEYNAQKGEIEASYKEAKQKCDALSDNAKDVCTVEAKGRYKVDKANLEAARNPSNESQYKARVARIDADYEVAKETCDYFDGNAEGACKAEAKAIRERATSEAKVQKNLSGLSFNKK